MRRYGAEMKWLPFDLHPEYPAEGVARETLERRYGEGFLEHTRATVEAAGLRHAPPPRIPRALRALQLGELARAEGAHAELHPRLFSAYWSEGRDIGDVEVLVSLAADVGLDADKTREVLEADALADRVQSSTTAAHRLGADGVPAWLIDDKVLVIGAQPHDVFDEVLKDLGYAGDREP